MHRVVHVEQAKKRNDSHSNEWQNQSLARRAVVFKESDMQIEVGKTYPTREGGAATILEIHEDEPVYQARGRIILSSGVLLGCAFWMPSGQYVVGRSSAFDLQPPQ